MKQRASAVGAVLAVSGMALAVTAVWLLSSRPQFPVAWRDITAGMLRSEVVAAIGSEPHDMRELKGFDIYTYQADASRCWQLQLDYADPNESKVSSVTFRYVDKRLGLRNLNRVDPGAEFRERHSE